MAREKINQLQSNNNQKKTGAKSKEIAEVLVMKEGAQTINYDLSKDNVRADLEKWAQKTGKSIFDLSPTAGLDIQCNNGVTISVARYLSNAGVALNLYPTVREAKNNLTSILIQLKRIAGFVLRDINYYSNKEYVKGDISKFKKSLGKEIQELNTVINDKKLVTCANGENVNWQQYLIDCWLSYNPKETRIEARNNLKDALNRIKILIDEGVNHSIQDISKVVAIPMDKHYFHNITNIKNDLEGFAINIDGGVTKLTTTHRKNKHLCANGAYISLRHYLSQAAHALGIRSDKSQKLEELAPQALLLLKAKIGIKMKTYPVRDKKYYENNLRRDIDILVKKIGKSVFKLTTDTKVYFNCTTGEEVNSTTYIYQAGVALGLVPNKESAIKNLSFILNQLKSKAGYLLRDANYYNSKDNVLYDLSLYAKEAGVDMADLNTSHVDLQITCINGEKCSLISYISNAGIALGLTKSSRESLSKGADILKLLKSIAGIRMQSYSAMDKTYFENAINIKYDIKTYAQKTDQTVFELSIQGGSEFVCSNGEKIKFKTYLSRAAIALGLAKNSDYVDGVRPKVLATLKKTAGFVLRDNEYYNHDNVKYDLEAYSLLVKRKPENLGLSHMVQITCKNGEIVSYHSYLKHARIELGFASHWHSRGSLGPTLKKLKEIAGFNDNNNDLILKRDAEYYKNLDFILQDFKAYAKEMGKSIHALTTFPGDVEIRCTNGEIVKWSTYLNNAVKCLGFAINDREATLQRTNVLGILKQKLGIIVRDKVYYENPENVRKDLLNFAINIKTSVELLKSYGLENITCSNGEVVKWRTYISNASVALGISENTFQDYAVLDFTLNKLKSIAGFETRTPEQRVHIANPLKYKELAKTIGRSAMMEILLAHHPEYKDIPFEKLEKIIAGYLGNVSVEGNEGENPFWGIERGDVGIILGIPALRETLATAIKNDYLQNLIDYRKANNFPITGFKPVYEEWKGTIIPKIQGLYPDIGELMDEVESDLYEVFDNTYHSENLIDGLDDAGREFPGFEQKYNIAEFLRKKRFLVADEMGLGKTATAICARENLKDEVKTALVVCPANMVTTWIERLGDGISPDGKQLGYFRQGRAPKVLVIDSKKDLQKDFSEYDYVLVSNARLTDDNAAQILNQDYQMLVVDEVHEMKNLSSGVWARNLVAISDKLNAVGYLMTLSGTPIPNTVKDIAIHMRLLYPHEFDGISNRDIVASMVNQDKLNIGLKLRNKMSRKRLLDWIPMPERKDELHFVEPTEFEKSIMHMIVEDDTQAAMQKIQKLRKLAMCPQALNPEWKNQLSGKMIKLGDMIIEKLKKNDKIMIVFNDFIEEIIRSDENINVSEEELIESEGVVVDYVKSRLTDLGVLDEVEILSYHGNTEKKERQTIQNKINNESGKKLTFLSGNAVKVGIDLSGIESVIVYNHPWTRSDLEQQISRVYRVGLKHDITVDHLITVNSIEEGIWDFTHEKERVIRKLIDGSEILTEEEKELLMSEDVTDVKNYHPDQQFAQHYFTQKEFLYDQFRMNKGIGEEKFAVNMNKLTRGSMTRGERYAEVYAMLGRRNYQFNANRVNNTIIAEIIRLEGEEMDINTARILDLASGSQLLSKTANPTLRSRITSNDINMHHFPSGDNVDELLSQDAYTNINSKEPEYMLGSMASTLYDEQSFDIVNCSLAWHYTGLDDSREIYDRVESLIEMNRILKPGGYMIINEIYSLEFAEREKLENALKLLGFEIVDKLSGATESTHDNSFKSHIVTLRKVSEPLDFELLLSKEYKKTVLQGLKFQATKQNGVSNQSNILESFTLNNKNYTIPLNIQDQNLKTEESNAFELIKSLKQLFKDEKSEDDPILNVPEATLHSNGMFSFMDKDSTGKKIRRVARKLSDGSFIFVN